MLTRLVWNTIAVVILTKLLLLLLLFILLIHYMHIIGSGSDDNYRVGL